MMGGFERLTVIEPSDSLGVRQLLRAALDNHQSATITVVPETTDNVVPLRTAKRQVTIQRIDTARYNHPENASFTGVTEDDKIIIVLVFTAESNKLDPAQATIVGDDDSPTP